jgi:predicted ATP-dependent endonuclease of OLD family
MKFKFENLGPIEKGEITLGNLTIIAGNNNLGKTYISYVIWGFLNSLRYWPDFLSINSYSKQLISNGNIIFGFNETTKILSEFLIKFDKAFSKQLSSLFNTQEDYFKDSNIICNEMNNPLELEYSDSKSLKIGLNSQIKYGWNFNSNGLQIFIEENTEISLSENLANFVLSIAISDVISNIYFKIPNIITSERTGIALFYKELDFTKSNIIELLKKEKPIHPLNLLETLTASYAEPIKNNINTARFFFETQKRKSFIVKENPVEYKKINKMLSTILDGNFKYTSDQILLKTKTINGKSESIPLYITSSSTKSLFLFDLYIRSSANKNQILMIDEPELNLHPTNQILMARIIANLVNLGVDVFITTHSDYMIREFNNLIMLSNDFKDKDNLIKKYDYDVFDILNPNKVKAYYVENRTINQAPIDKYGIDYKLFDDTIYKLNRKSDDIYYSIEE